MKSQNKIELKFYSKEDGCELSRTCAPMDYGPSRRANNQDDRYHFWDYDSDQKNHVLSLLPNQVNNIEILPEKFEPAEFINWSTNWFIKRDWGEFS